MAIAIHRDFDTSTVGKSDHLHHVFDRIGIQHSRWQPTDNVPKVIRNCLPRSIIEDQSPAKIRQVIAQQALHIGG
jgi:hypothetical protein